MRVTKLGEFGLIERFKKSIKTDASVLKGIGDDCAVLKFNKKNYQLFTCDMLVEGVDFTLKEKPYLIGRKSIAVSISDIAACAGLPRYCLVSLGIPTKTSVEFIDQILKGMLAIARQYKINLAGGDLSRSEKLIIDVSMLGNVEKKNLVLRSGAQRGDIIFVTGTLGGSIRGKHLRFIPRVKAARFLVENFKINSMIDISDGLAGDLGHILEESRVGAVIYEELIPLSKEAKSLEDALYSGEDFELLFTLKPKEAKKIYHRRLTDFKPIGEISERKYGFRLIDKKGSTKIIIPKGFRHF
jgi:thiamine-monophosphate kinase